MIKRAFLAKYAMIAGGDKKYSPVKASVDVTRFTNAKHMGTTEYGLRKIANQYWERFFGNARTWVENEGFEMDIWERANMMINSQVRVYIYVVSETRFQVLFDEVISWKQ